MTDREGGAKPRTPWFENRTLVIAWLLAFFPVGLYAVWKGSLFDRNWKIGISVVVGVLFVAGINFTNPVYVFLLYPAAVFLLRRDKDIERKTVYIFGGCWFLVLILAATQMGGGGGSYGDGGQCAAVMTQGNCTYYRDSDCNVISRQCS